MHGTIRDSYPEIVESERGSAFITVTYARLTENETVGMVMATMRQVLMAALSSDSYVDKKKVRTRS